MHNSNLHDVTSLTTVSGAFEISEKAQLSISDSLFYHNSALVSSIFRVETEAALVCQNCTIYENFAITNGVFSVTSFATMDIKDSHIYNNSAIEFVIGSVFLTGDASTISNTEIYQNEFISKASIPTEISAA